MSNRTRKGRGTATDAVSLFVKVDPAVRAKVDHMAASLDVSLTRLMEELVRRAEVDTHGRPMWWPEIVPDQEELPLKSA